MQEPMPENKRSLTAQSAELGKNCQDYKYFTLESELINGSKPSFQLSTSGYQRHVPSLLSGFFWPYSNTQPRAQEAKVSTRGRKDSPVQTQSLMTTLLQKTTEKEHMGLVSSR